MDAALEAMKEVKGANRKQLARHFSVNEKSMGNRYSDWEASEPAKQKLSRSGCWDKDTNGSEKYASWPLLMFFKRLFNF